MIARSHFRLWENAGFKYFRETRQLFGLGSALCQVSPIFNLVRNWRYFRIERSLTQRRRRTFDLMNKPLL